MKKKATTKKAANEAAKETQSGESIKKSVWELAMDPNREPLITKIVDMRAVLR